MTSLLRILRSVPLAFWLTLGLTGASYGASVLYHRNIEAAREAGRQEVLNAARFDSLVYQRADTQTAHATAKTDTILRTVTQRVTQVRIVTVAVHDTIRQAFPVVDTLMIESQALAKAVDSLVVAITEERAAAKVALDLRDVAIRDSRLENARKDAQIAALMKRPTRFQTFAVGVASAAGGIIAGKVL